jgi:hypothetical protein
MKGISGSLQQVRVALVAREVGGLLVAAAGLCDRVCALKHVRSGLGGGRMVPVLQDVLH